MMANTIMCDCCRHLERVTHADTCPRSENFLEQKPYIECLEEHKVYLDMPIFIRDAGLFRAKEGKYDINRVLEGLQRAQKVIEGKFVICHLAMKALHKLQRDNWPNTIILNLK